MKRLMMVAALVVGMLAGPQGAMGAEDVSSISYLRKQCAGRATPDIERGFCLGIIRGYENGFNMGVWVAVRKIKGHKALRKTDVGMTGYERWCKPEGVTFGQMATVFLRWAERNPSEWHLHYMLGITEAFAEAWPCKK